MARTRESHRRGGAQPFAQLGPVGVAIPISTGTARLERETDGSVLLEVNGVPSSAQHPDPRHLIFEYMRWMQIVLQRRLCTAGGPVHPEVAHLGGGGCALPRALNALLPGSRQTVVEVDALLAEQVRTWFDLPRSPSMRLRIDDAVSVLHAWRTDRFDVLVRDVFAGSVTPEALVDARAAAAAARVLRPGGMYLANSAAGPTRVLGDELVTLRTVFAHVDVIVEPGVLAGRRRGNSVLVASDQPLPEGIDRDLRSDAVSVRLAGAADLERLAAAGRVLTS